MKKVGRIFRESMVSHIREGLEKKNNIFLMSYTEVSGLQMNNLRKGLKSIKAEIYVSRNRIAGLALKELKFDRLTEKVKGQTAFVFSDTDAVTVSKTLVKFSKECQGIIIQGGLLKGSILEQQDVERLSELPSKEVLLAQLLGTLQAPLTRLAYVLNGKTHDLLSLLKQLGERKGGK